ncbi:MAG TPA: alpha/beta hydrolase family protein [Terriglobales bacterium]|nr:alpha/beta hydrolase family protein [Terriglobales bacterium]
MNKMRVALLLILGVTAAYGQASAQGRVECSTVKSARMKANVAFCAFLPPSYDANKAAKFPVLYLLHGLGDNHESMINTGTWNMVEQLQRQKRIGEFVIITPNAGRSFYLNSKNGRVPYEGFFIREFLPAMEQRFRLNAGRAGRAITGISMGGYGALRFAFKYPQLFTSVAAHSAALIERMPQGAEYAGIVNILGSAFGVPFDASFWERNTPFFYAKTFRPNGLRIYLDCGDRDDYGFDQGTRALDRLLGSRKIAHEAHIYPGNHGWAYFAEHLDESLVFQSKALGAK